MFRILVLILCFSASFGMSVRASKKLSYASPDGSNSMFVERSSSADLDSSASGFVYRSNGLGPATVLQLEPHPAFQAMDQINHAYESLLQPTAVEYSTGGGSEGLSNGFSAGGEKGEKGYNGFDSFHKGLLKKLDKSQDSGFYHDNAGHSKGHHNDAGFYGSYGQANKGEVGGKHAEEESHKKGHKTSGYHNVYHKDEYKKEHSFYDEADKNGQHEDYAKGQAAYGQEHGGYNKGDHHDAGFQAGEQGKKGFFDKGHFAEEAEGHKGGEGLSSHFSTGADYGNTGGGNFQKGFGFGSGYGGYLH